MCMYIYIYVLYIYMYIYIYSIYIYICINTVYIQSYDEYRMILHQFQRYWIKHDQTFIGAIPWIPKRKPTQVPGSCDCCE